LILLTTKVLVQSLLDTIQDNEALNRASKLLWIKRITVPSRSSWKFSPLPIRN